MILQVVAAKQHDEDNVNIHEIRRLALAQALYLKCNGRQVDMAQQTGIRPDYISRMLNDGPSNKRIGGDYARGIEEKLGLPPGWLDQRENTKPSGESHMAALNVLQIPRLQHPALTQTTGRPSVFVIAREEFLEDSAGSELRHMRSSERAMRICEGRRETLLVLNLERTTLVDGDIFVFEHGNTLKTRRAVFVDGEWRARADLTPDGRNQEFAVADAEVVGAVIWAGGPL